MVPYFACNLTVVLLKENVNTEKGRGEEGVCHPVADTQLLKKIRFLFFLPKPLCESAPSCLILCFKDLENLSSRTMGLQKQNK